VGGQWVALVGFGSAVLSCAARDAWVGWDRPQQYARLRHIANNQRFCVLPAGQVPNLASAVLARTLRRLGADYVAAYGHRVVAVETFTDPARHSGVCYAASNFTPVGHTLGFSRSAGSYHHHGNPKRVWMRALRRGAAAMLAAPFDHPLLTRPGTGHVDVNGLVLAGSGGLLSMLEGLVDPRARRGVRHRIAPVLAMAVVAALAGAQSFTAVAREVAGLPQAALARLGARRNRSTGAYVAPSEATIRRTIQMVDTEYADELVGTWLSEQVRHGRVSMAQLGARLRPAPEHAVRTAAARHPTAARTRLFSALVHAEGATAGKDQLPVPLHGGYADEAPA
jgi:hypothetical protein